MSSEVYRQPCYYDCWAGGARRAGPAPVLSWPW